jgi:hypothetical protein
MAKIMKASMANRSNIFVSINNIETSSYEELEAKEA